MVGFHAISRRGGIFTHASCGLVHEITGGLPRLINILCDLALVYGYADSRELIEEDLLREFLEASRKRGIYAQFVDNVRVTRCKIHDCGYAGAMSLISRANDRVKLVRANDWQVPAGHPDLAPGSDLGLIHNLLRSLRDDAESLAGDVAIQQGGNPGGERPVARTRRAHTDNPTRDELVHRRAVEGLADDVGVAGVLGQLPQDLQAERPDGAFASPVHDVAVLDLGHRAS